MTSHLRTHLGIFSCSPWDFPTEGKRGVNSPAGVCNGTLEIFTRVKKACRFNVPVLTSAGEFSPCLPTDQFTSRNHILV
jgi:hypothetical protein